MRRVFCRGRDAGRGSGTERQDEAQLCALGGARFEGKPQGPKNLTVDVGRDAHP
jgi:hypothetical protein